MHITPKMHEIRANTQYISGSVHYNRRKYDGKYEVVGRLTDKAVDELGLTIGGEVVLDIQDRRENALTSVRFFRHQQEV